MPAIDPVPGNDRLAEIGASFERMGDADNVFPRILGHVPGYAEAIWDAMAEALFEGNVDHRLKENVRVRLARIAQDPYFSELRTVDDEEHRIDADIDDAIFTDAERWALRYATLMYTSPESVDGAFYDEGKQHFSEAQIMELGGLIAVHYGMAVFMRTLMND